MISKKLSRRGFVKSAAVGVGSVALLRAAKPTFGALGANERISIACIGVGGQGKTHLVKDLIQMNDIRIAAVCDVDQTRLDEAAEISRGAANGKDVYPTNDFRKILDMKDVDAVLIATPGHWHGIPAIWACRAGKDVYIEKPFCHSIKEGRTLVDVAKENKRIVQAGMQQRSIPIWINAVNRIKTGELGPINMIHVWNAWNSHEMFADRLVPVADQDNPPPGVDYDMWLGPAPLRKFNPARFHDTHYFFWEYGGGMMIEWAVHLFDIVVWAMGPRIDSVSATGGKYVLKDARDTPDTAVATFDCGDYVMNYSLRHANGWRPHGDLDHGIEFFGKDKTLQIDRKGFAIYKDADRGSRKPMYVEENTAYFDKSKSPMFDHKRNFFDCMRSRKQPVASAEEGHLGSIPGHLANISYRVGRQIHWDAKGETIVQAPRANELPTPDVEANKLLGPQSMRAPWHL